MRNLFIGLFVLFMWSSCDMRHIAKTTILNQNTYPISITITTANISQTFDSIAPNEKRIAEYEWTNINNVDGTWSIVVTNLITNTKDSFSHGYFSSGILSNYIDIVCKNEQMKVVVSD